MDIKEIALRIGEEADEYADAKLQSKGEFHPDWHTVRDEYFAEALIAEIAKGNEPTPEFLGYAALGTGQYLLIACPATGEFPPELIITVATEDEEAGRVIGDLKYVTPGTEIHPKDIAVRLAFFSVAGLDALEQQLRVLREESFHDTFPPTAKQIANETAWQPIETAPVLSNVLVARFDYGQVCWVTDARKSKFGFWSTFNGRAVYEPTHWMPLPTPPKRSMEGV